jgi:hypothetical protein
MLNVFLVMTDPKGIYAFQPFTRERWDKAKAIADLHKNKELFKMIFTDQEEHFIKWMINQKKFMAAAYYITRIRLQRGDYRD